MGKKLLLDTNIAIYFLLTAIPANEVEISFITKIELLAYPSITPEEEMAAQTFLSFFNIITIDASIINKTIAIRKEVKIKLPDAIIAATALVNNLQLLSSNLQDFSKVEDLTIINPLTI
jgi:predicted nucleic acid-binding protein